MGRIAKLPYRVPSMGEIEATPWNGRRVASLFAGCGGSSLGYRLAGFRVAWANEFIDAAADVYALNARAGTVIDRRDVRDLKPEDLLDAAGLAAGELDVLDGSPPCASFSTAGRRSLTWGKVRKYSDTTQRSDDLFFEYARLLRGVKPKAFVAENVSGLVKGVSKGYFIEILRELKSCGYRVAVKLLDAQWLGVPQARLRAIFVGVREDLAVEPRHPAPLAFRYSVRDACPWLGSLEGANGFNRHAYGDAALPAATIQAQRTLAARDATLRGGNKAPFDAKGKTLSLDRPLPTVMGGDTLGLAPFQFEVVEPPNISRFAIGKEAMKLAPGQASDKYLNLVRANADAPCPTVTAAGGEPGIASVIHPSEPRKFTIAELKRICAFPDDFRLTGTYAQQWERLGRAVPPLMMRAVAVEVAAALDAAEGAPARGRARSGARRDRAARRSTSG
jgi:DNA (cytosine-5)-methyltransferase 1